MDLYKTSNCLSCILVEAHFSEFSDVAQMVIIKIST